jgi:hypothetical protein
MLDMRANMKNLSLPAKTYIFGTILVGMILMAWMAVDLNWANPTLYLLVVLGAIGQTLKLEGSTNRTNYSIAWFIYGFTFIEFGLPSTMFVIFISHLVEWSWHKYPWYIQSYNIGNHAISVSLAWLVYQGIGRGAAGVERNTAIGLMAANAVFVFLNHFLLAIVIKLARNQSFAESGLFEFLTLFLDFAVLSMGTVTALVWQSYPLASLLNILPLYLLYNALRVPALKRQLQEIKKVNPQPGQSAGHD